MKSYINNEAWGRLAYHSHDLLCVTDAHGRFLHLNGACLQILGYTREEMTGRLYSEFLHPEDLAEAEGMPQPPKGLSSRFRYLHKNGQVVYLAWSATWSPEEKVYYGIGRDNTTEVTALETIERQAHQLNMTLESITDAFLTVDRDWRITYLNSEAERVLPFDRAKHMGVSIWEIFPEEVGGESYRQYQRALATGQTAIFATFLERHRKWFRVKASPSGEGLSIYFDDITELMNSRHELEKLSLVASNTTNGVLIANRDWEIEWVNMGFTRLTGFSPEEAVGKKPADFLHSPKTDKGAFDQESARLYAGEPVSYELQVVKKSGEELWLNIDISPILGDGGQIIGFIGVQTDITAHKNLERELSQLAKDLYRQNSDLQQFTYIVSHNLRAPLANVMALSDLLPSLEPGSESFGKSLGFLRQSSYQLDTVMRDMNTILSIRESGGSIEREEFPLADMVDQAMKPFREALGGAR